MTIILGADEIIVDGVVVIMVSKRPHRAGRGAFPVAGLDETGARSKLNDGRSLVDARRQYDKNARPNPLDAPGLVLKLVDSPLTESLEGALQAIDKLPPEFMAALPRHLNPALIDELRLLTRGMRKLRENIPPYREELMVLSGADRTLEPLARKFRNAAAFERIEEDVAHLIQREIVLPLSEAAPKFRWDGGNYGAVEWAVEASDAADSAPSGLEFT
jgi:hypothetical protein